MTNAGVILGVIIYVLINPYEEQRVTYTEKSESKTRPKIKFQTDEDS